jgi:CubicO group peptidase (beta-lactamase class C family)
MGSKQKVFTGLVFCLSLALVFGVTTQTAGAFQAYTHNALTDKVDELFKQWDKDDSPGAAVGIFKDGRIIYARGYGIANLEYALPWTPQTPSRIGSISKQFIGMCIAILAEQGKISLDDNIRKYIPDWPEYNGPIKLSHLMHHTSGVREYLTLVELMGKPEGSGYVYTPKELVKTLSRQKELNFKPGDEYSYSNSGYFLLSEIVNRVSGMKTSAFAKKYIFDPLGMNNTHFHDDPNMIVKNRAYGYSPEKEGGYRLDILRLKVIGDLGVFTTVEDFLKWDQNFYDNKLGAGTQNLINMMQTRGKLNNGKEIPYAFGLNIDHYGGLRTVSHGGSAVGYVAQYMQFPDQRFSVVILSNLSNFSPGRIARNIADLYLADQFTESPTPRRRQRPRGEKPKPVKLTSSQLQTYIGNYYSDELDITYALDVESNNLVLKLRETSSILTAYSTDNFGWGRRRLEFKRGKDKRIIGFILQAGRVKNLKFQKIKE